MITQIKVEEAFKKQQTFKIETFRKVGLENFLN